MARSTLRWHLRQSIRHTALALCGPIFLQRFFSKETGADYHIGFWRKVQLIYRMYRNRFKVVTTSGLLGQIVMVTELLRVPRSLTGVVVECGSYEGGSTVNLSLACALVGRSLHVFDSFEGLPQPAEADTNRFIPSTGDVYSFRKGGFNGSLETVRSNVRRFGNIDVCKFHVGWLEDTLPRFSERCVFAFCDVDLKNSYETCLMYLWPTLADSCCLFTHEANHMEIAGLFFDKVWWSKNLHCDPPGLVGGGSGLGLYDSGLGYFRSSIGFALKNGAREESHR